MIGKFVKSKINASLLATFMGAAVFMPGVSQGLPEAGAAENSARSLPGNCAYNADGKSMARKTPRIYSDFQTLGKLPLTGETVYQQLKNPANGIISCMDKDANNGMGGQFDILTKTVHVNEGNNTTATFHEYFHAAQNISGADQEMYDLSMRDAAIALLLAESSAVAYELIAEKEAEAHSSHLYERPAEVVRPAPGVTRTITRGSTSDDPETRKAFEVAYRRSLKDNAGLNAVAREKKALEAGGKAVAKFLLEGKNRHWTRFYSQLTIININNNHRVFRDDGRETKPGYEALRQNVYSKLGAVSPSLNLTPDELLGPEADQYIGTYLRKNNLQVAMRDIAPPVTVAALSVK